MISFKHNVDTHYINIMYNDLLQAPCAHSLYTYNGRWSPSSIMYTLIIYIQWKMISFKHKVYTHYIHTMEDDFLQAQGIHSLYTYNGRWSPSSTRHTLIIDMQCKMISFKHNANTHIIKLRVNSEENVEVI